MNKEIIISENKILKLNQVISKAFIINDAFTSKPLELHIKEFYDYMKNNKIIGYGPLIIESGIVGNDEKKMILKFMRQTKNESISVVYPYEFYKEIKTPSCLFSRFQGLEKDSSIASLKMRVYAYENNLVLDIDSYTITNNENDEVIVDTFIPIIGRC